MSSSAAMAEFKKRKDNPLIIWLIGNDRVTRKKSLVFYTFAILFICIFCANCEYLGTEFIQYGNHINLPKKIKNVVNQDYVMIRVNHTMNELKT